MPDLKMIVSDGNEAKFSHYRDGNFFYGVKVQDEEYSFPIPVEDAKGTTLFVEFKAITLMRWIRKAIEDKTFQPVKESKTGIAHAADPDFRLARYQAPQTGVTFPLLRDFMHRRTVVPSLLFIFLVSSISSAQQTPNSTNNRLAAILRLPVLTPSDWQALFSEAESGNAESQYWLGTIYDAGRLLPKDSEKSLHWYEESAEQGYAPAEYVVCLMQSNREELESERCMWRAAEKGVPEAQFWIGVAYDQQLWFGIRDKHEACKWFKQAAERGYVDAEVELGRCYETGDGVEQNCALAAEWYRKAAEHVPNLGGAGQGRNYLGLLYMDGLGVPKDYVQAYMWFSLAGAEANLSNEQLEMTPAQVLRAQQMASEWEKGHPDPAIY